jgi:hypothetical protein
MFIAGFYQIWNSNSRTHLSIRSRNSLVIIEIAIDPPQSEVDQKLFASIGVHTLTINEICDNRHGRLINADSTVCTVTQRTSSRMMETVSACLERVVICRLRRKLIRLI